MRWLSFLPGRRSAPRGWMPVSNDDPDETGMDDLMRMALGHYQDDDDEDLDEGDNSNSGVLLRGEANCDAAEECDQPVFCQPRSSIWSSVVGLARSSPSTPSPAQVGSVSRQGQDMPSGMLGSALPGSPLQETVGQQQDSSPRLNTAQYSTGSTSCCNHLRNLTFPPQRWYFIVLSLMIALVFIGLNVGLGIYSLVFYNPDQLVIDKSVKSFSIPNHKAYRNFEALMLARKDNSSSGRYRRDSSDALRGHSLWGSSDLHSSRRSKRETLLAKEDKMLKHTASVLQRLNLKNTGFSRKAMDISPPHLFSSRQSSSNAGSLGSSLSSLFHRVKRSASEITCMFEYQSIARWKMHVIYLAQGDEDANMFTKERLQTAHEIEHSIIQHPDFNSFCLRDPHLEIYDPAVRKMNGCIPLNSLLTYFFPSVDTEGNVYYDGLGTNIDDVDSALKLAMNHETFYYYVDDKINKTYQKSYLLRSEVLFGAPLAGE